MSTTTLSNDTNSVYSQMTGGKNMKKINNNKRYHIDPECQELINKAKAEWNLTNKELEKMIVEKIIKNYNKNKKKKLNQKYGYNG